MWGSGLYLGRIIFLNNWRYSGERSLPPSGCNDVSTCKRIIVSCGGGMGRIEIFKKMRKSRVRDGRWDGFCRSANIANRLHFWLPAGFAVIGQETTAEHVVWSLRRAVRTDRMPINHIGPMKLESDVSDLKTWVKAFFGALQNALRAVEKAVDVMDSWFLRNRSDDTVNRLWCSLPNGLCGRLFQEVVGVKKPDLINFW